MNTRFFSEALTGINDKYLTEALQYHKKKNATWLKWGAIAACACLIISLGTFLFTSPIRLPDSNFGGGGSDHDGSGGDPNTGGSGGLGHDESSVFMSYAGPVFPLTALEAAEGIEAQRNISFDFPADYRCKIIVTDAYTLANTTDQDITITAVYPYVSYFSADFHSAVTVNGSEPDISLFPGMYCYNDDLSSWEDYKALLADGTYMEAAFAAYPELNRPVTVYKLTDVTYSGDDPFAANPTLAVSCNIDYDKTTILTYGFNGGHYDIENGYYLVNFSIPDEWWDKDEEYYMIVIGDDIGEYTVQGYRNGGCYPNEKIDGVSASIERYETTLGKALKTAAGLRYDNVLSNILYDRCLADGVTFDMYYGEICRTFANKETYRDLETLFSSVEYFNRVFYSTFEVTIPSHSAAEITVEQTKEASYDFGCSYSENAGVDGYDVVTRLGSTLDFTAQSASLTAHDNIEIVRQNFGFDLEHGITQVDLDLSQERYYLEIKRTK